MYTCLYAGSQVGRYRHLIWNHCWYWFQDRWHCKHTLQACHGSGSQMNLAKPTNWEREREELQIASIIKICVYNRIYIIYILYTHYYTLISRFLSSRANFRAGQTSASLKSYEINVKPKVDQSTSQRVFIQVKIFIPFGLGYIINVNFGKIHWLCWHTKCNKWIQMISVFFGFPFCKNVIS